MTNFNKKRLFMTTLLSGAVMGFAAAPTIAQTADDEIVVTGSRIKKQDFTANAPVATVEAAQFERTGAINTENLLNTLPQTVPGLDRTSNNPGNGSATVNLRGLGSNRTLVLVNGTRQVPFGQNGVVDLNTIPASLLENVEVLTGGASSVYGSDAVAGVVNFIYKDDFEGMEANFGAQMTQHGDAGLYNADFTVGANFDNGRGNTALNVSYTSREALFQGDRDFSNVALFDNGDSSGLEPGGSSGTPSTTLFASLPVPGNTGRAIFGDGGTVAPFDFDGDENSFYNYAPVNFLQLPQERMTMTAIGNYEINEHVEGYARASFASNKVDSELAPTPIFQTSTISLDGNPFLTAQTQQNLSGNNSDFVGIGARAARVFSDGGTAFTDTNTCTNCVFDNSFVDENEDGIDDDMRADIAPLIDTDGDGIADTATGFFGRRLVEVGPRQTKDDNLSFQITAGLRGETGIGNWDYDVYLQEGRTVRAQAQNGNVNRARYNAGLLLADADGDGNVDLDADGNATCADDPGGATVACTPMNIFGAGNISEESAAYLRTAVSSRSTYEQTVLAANFTGDLGEMSITGSPIGAAWGVEYIENEAAFDPSQDLAASTIAGFNGSPASGGKYDVYSLYGELAIPVVEGLPFAEAINIDLAGRISEYSTAGSTSTYKIGGDWVVNDQVRFRGGFNTATRAPNIGELFAPQGQGFPGAQDPCSANATETITAAISAVCVATGVPASAVGTVNLNTISGQVETLSGGNPDLEVETAETFTIGAVFNPEFVPGLSLSIDYYDIVIEDAIAAFGGGANNVLTTCYTDTAVGGAGSDFCNAITRRADGSIDFIALTAQNVAEITTKGIDLAASYSFDLADLVGSDWGEMSVRYLGTIVNENDFVAFTGADVIECAGNFGTDCGEPDSNYRHRVTANLNKDAYSFQTVWRLVGEVEDSNDTLFVNSIDTTHYFDSSLTWDVADNLGLTFGINNVFNQDPPVIGDNDEQANTYPATYDVFGRTFFANAKVKF